MKTEVKLITPAIAAELLATYHKNRSVRDKKVNLFAFDMNMGRWKADTGESIKISKNGYLLDGQHRLLAVVKSNQTIPFLIIYDIDDSVMDVLDTGTPRNASDVLRFNGIKNDKWVAAMVRSYLLLNKGLRSKAGGAESYITNADVLNEYNNRSAFWDEALKYCKSWYLSYGKILTPSLLGGIYSMFYNINADNAVEFMDYLCEGANLTRTHPIYLLRIKLMNDKTSKLHSMPYWIKIALIYKTWNSYRLGEEPRMLKFTPESESFPKPI